MASKKEAWATAEAALDPGIPEGRVETETTALVGSGSDGAAASSTERRAEEASSAPAAPTSTEPCVEAAPVPAEPKETGGDVEAQAPSPAPRRAGCCDCITSCPSKVAGCVFKGAAACPGACFCVNLLITLAITGVGIALMPPEPETDFTSFTKAVTNSSLQNDAFLAALSLRTVVGGGRTGRRLSETEEGILLEQLTEEDRKRIASGDLEIDLDAFFDSHQTPSRRLQNQVGTPLFKSFDLVVAYEPRNNSLFEGEEIFTQEAVQRVQEFERKLRGLGEWQKMCGDTMEQLLCNPGTTFLNFAMPQVEYTGSIPTTLQLNGQSSSMLPLEIVFRLVDQMGLGRVLLPKQWFNWLDPANRYRRRDLKTTTFRSVFRFKYIVYYTGDRKEYKDERMKEVKESWATFSEGVLLDTLQEYGDNEDFPVRVFFTGDGLETAQVWQALIADSMLAIGSFTFVGFYLMFHTSSIFLAIVGIICMGLSVPLAYIVYALLASTTSVSIVSFLALFVIVGIGADDVFVFTDFWKMSAEEEVCKDDWAARVRWTYVHAGKAAIATSATTALAFFANMASVLRPLREFGCFMGLCVVFLWILVVLIYTPFLVFESTWLSKCRVPLHKLLAPIKNYFAGRAGDSDKGILSQWASLIHTRRHLVLAAGVGATIIFLALTVLMLEVDMSVPDLFRYDHNLGRGKDVFTQYYDLKEVMKASFKSQNLTKRVCDTYGFRWDDNLCTLFWCKPDATVPSDQCACSRKQLACLYGNDIGHMEATTRVIMGEEMTDADVEGPIAAYVSADDQVAFFDFAQRLRSMRKIQYSSVVFDTGSGLRIENMYEVVSSMKRLSNTASCGWQDVCYCGTTTCQNMPTGSAWQAPPAPLLWSKESARGGGRRLGDSASDAQAEDMVQREREFEASQYDAWLDEHGLVSSDMDRQYVGDVEDRWSKALVVHGEQPGELPASAVRSLAAFPRQLTLQVPRHLRVVVEIIFGIFVEPGSRLLGERPAEDRWFFLKDHETAHPWAQRDMHRFCEDIPPSLRVVSKFCWMSIFKRWLYEQGVPWPVPAKEDYGRLMFHFWTFQRVGGKNAQDFLWIRAGEVRASYYQVVCNVYKNSTARDGIQYKEMWDDYVEKWNSEASIHVRGAWHTSKLYVNSEAAEELLSSTGTTLLVIILFSFMSMVVFTGDLPLAVFVVTSTLWVVVGLFFFIIVILQLKLGAIEVIALIAFIGYALDYSFHIAHEYSHDDALLGKDIDSMSADEIRDVRTSFSLVSIGGAALGSAVTTIGSSIFLLFCNLTIFPKLGSVVIFVTGISIVAAFIPLPAALLTSGPLRPGATKQRFKAWCRAKMAQYRQNWREFVDYLWSDDEPKGEEAGVERPASASSSAILPAIVGALVLIVAAGVGIGIATASSPKVDPDFYSSLRADEPVANIHRFFLNALEARSTAQQSDLRQIGDDLYMTLQVEVAYELPEDAWPQEPRGMTYNRAKLDGWISAAKIERRLREADAWKERCSKLDTQYQGDCKLGISFMNFALPQRIVSKRVRDSKGYIAEQLVYDGTGVDPFPLAGVVRLARDMGLQRILFPIGLNVSEPANTTYDNETYVNTSALRTMYRFRTKCCKATDSADKIADDAKKLREDWKKFVEDAVLPVLAEPFPDVDDEEQHPLRVWYNCTGLGEIYAEDVMAWDGIFYLCALFCIFVCLLCHTGSPLLGTCGLVVVFTSVCIGYAALAAAASTEVLNLAMLAPAALLVAWCASEAVLMYTDVWRASSCIGKNCEIPRYFWTISRAGGASLAATLVTVASGLACLSSAIPALRQLGVFVATGVPCAALLAFFYAPVCSLDDRIPWPGTSPAVEDDTGSQPSRMQVWARNTRRMRLNLVLWTALGTFASVVLALSFVTDRIPYFDQAPRVFRMRDNFGGRGRYVFSQFEPVEEDLFHNSFPSAPQPVEEQDVCNIWGSGDSGRAPMNADADKSSCGFFWCTVPEAAWAGLNESRCDCYRREKKQNCGNATTTPTADIKQRFVGLKGPSRSAGYYAMDPSATNVEVDWDSYVDGSLKAGNDVTVKSLPPLILEEWVTGDIVSEPVVELSGIVQRTDTSSCGYEDVCFCSQHRCQASDFMWYPGKDCTGATKIVLYDGAGAGFSAEPLQCLQKCRELPGCTGVTKVISGGQLSGQCLFWTGAITEPLEEYESDNRDCYIRQGFENRPNYAWETSSQLKHVDNYAAFGGYMYATIDNVRVDAVFGTDAGWSIYKYGKTCQNAWNKQPMPDGWELVPDEFDPNGLNISEFIMEQRWSTRSVVTADGRCHVTGEYDGKDDAGWDGFKGKGDNHCKTSANMLGTDGTMYWATQCYSRVLIRKRQDLSYVGCFGDDRLRDFKEGPMDFGYQLRTEREGWKWVPYDTDTCREACRDWRNISYAYFALQAGGFCQCGNHYGTRKQYERVPDSECGAVCPGQEGLTPTRYCGGQYRNAVYHVHTGTESEPVSWTQLCTSCDYSSPATVISALIEKRPAETISACQERCAADTSREDVIGVGDAGKMDKCQRECARVYTAEEYVGDVSLEGCKQLCNKDPQCMAIDYGKNIKANQCYINRGGNGKSFRAEPSDSDFDAYVIRRDSWFDTVTQELYVRDTTRIGIPLVVQRSMVHVTFGLEFEDSMPLLAPKTTQGWKLRDIGVFDPSTPWAQREMIAMCELATHPLYALRVTQKLCWMASFRKWVEDKGRNFPVPSNEFTALAIEFAETGLVVGETVVSYELDGTPLRRPELLRQRVSEPAGKFIWVRNGVIRAMYNSWEVDVNANASQNTRAYFYSQGEGVIEYKALWQHFIDSWHKAESTDIAWVTSPLWAQEYARDALTSSTFTVLVLLVVFALAGTLLATGRVLVAFTVAGNVMFVEAGIAALFFAVVRWECGAVELLAMVGCACFAAAPSVHVAMLYNSVTAPDAKPTGDALSFVRFWRVRFSLTAGGGAELRAAAAGACCAFMALASRMASVQTFGAGFMTTVLLATFGGVATVPAALCVLGPVGGAGPIAGVSETCSAVCGRLGRLWPPPASGSSSDGTDTDASSKDAATMIGKTSDQEGEAGTASQTSKV